jgi:Mg2+-importing ATPase
MATSMSSQDIFDLYRQLQSGPTGISSSLAAKRLEQQLKNTKIHSRSYREFQLLVRQFKNPLVLLLLVAVILSALLSDVTDALIILVILIITGFFGFFQELHAGRSLEKLQQLTKTNTRVIRDDKEVDIPVSELVQGDVVLLNAGDIVPADCRILESNELHVNESTLTGESFPVEKKEGSVPDDAPISKKINCLWQGSSVVSGTGKALAIYTGAATLFGGMAHSLSQTPDTAFEKGIRHFGYFLLRITVVLSLIILGVNLYFHKTFFDSILFSLALAVGMAPELLPAIMTFTMSAGANRMMKKKVVVKKLSSIFNFGEVNVLCTDKTGTITEGSVRVANIVNVAGVPDEQLRIYAFLNAAFQNGFDNPIDTALKALNLNATGYKKINELPYDFIRKRLSVSVQKQEKQMIVTKGAVQNVLEVCSSMDTGNGSTEKIDALATQKITTQFANFSQQGYRVLGLACKDLGNKRMSREDEKDMTFLGFILLEDHLKETVLSSITRLKQLQVTIKVITGDNRYAALRVAQEIDIKTPVILNGEELNALSSEALTIKALQTDIFAEVEPHQKERIVKALQLSNLSVAYMGDGVNDVAAINAADVGISTNNAVDVAREAADFVLLEKDLSVLADGIYEGRRSFANSMKYVFISTGATFGNMFSVAGASLILPFLPMLPKQILLNNLVTDLPFISIASDTVEPNELASPRKWNLKMIKNFMLVFGIHSSLFDFLTFYLLYYFFNLSGAAFQSGWFLESAISEILILFVVRTRKPFLKSKPGILLLASGLLAVVITLYLPFSPFAGALGFSVTHVHPILAILLILFIYMVTADWLKLAFFKWIERPGTALHKEVLPHVLFGS